jgi:hypothetical protein
MKLKKLLLIAAALCLCASCTSVNVWPVDPELAITDVCIRPVAQTLSINCVHRKMITK